ncbi:hypothetical protein BH93_11460 [Rhodococcoides fascians A25f]|uniref:hypothetical protein n=1 Tax=Rhodococcoides fascians TaxID=1828 RepID=UPI000B30694F|nr:hypothetical protein [Rhodococcus fascians]QII05907.1 hypothetical protein BH93_11460 [Rhodococcus fascians A25f]
MKDRTGEEIDERHLSVVQSHHCSNGWIGYDDEARPIPCLRCRPHLAQTATINDSGKNL